MTITKDQWAKIDEVFPTNDGTDWDGVSELTVLIILQQLKMLNDVRAALKQYNQDFDPHKMFNKLKDIVGDFI